MMILTRTNECSGSFKVTNKRLPGVKVRSAGVGDSFRDNMPVNDPPMYRRATFARVPKRLILARLFKKSRLSRRSGAIDQRWVGTRSSLHPSTLPKPRLSLRYPLFCIFCCRIGVLHPFYCRMHAGDSREQAFPGTSFPHSKGDVEYATLINFYFGSTTHIIGQIVLYGALTSNAIQGLVLSAQVLQYLIYSLLIVSLLIYSGNRVDWLLGETLVGFVWIPPVHSRHPLETNLCFSHLVSL